MIIKISKTATTQEFDLIINHLREFGFQPFLSETREDRAIAVIGAADRADLSVLTDIPGVQSIEPNTFPFVLASRQFKPTPTIVNVSGVPIGGKDIVVIAGPCAVESPNQLFQTARAVKASGASLLRGGAFKPRTSPYDFQGLGVAGLKILREASDETGLPVVTEVMGVDEIDAAVEYADMLQVGARNMQNFSLLRHLAKSPRPIFLKRGPSAQIKEWLLAAEYLLSGGNPNVVLCERGIKTFDTELRNTLDLTAVALVRELSHLPVIVDPSHATGRSSLVPAAARAAVAIGADGLIMEVHPEPVHALSDGPQSLTFEGFDHVMKTLTEPLRQVASRTRTQLSETKKLAIRD
jgi:3-deoxy-7-phosphoheptulonate synthase